ncbi:6876_t:CDS:2, partial [Entrophospora sp. SA101]
SEEFEEGKCALDRIKKAKKSALSKNWVEKLDNDKPAFFKLLSTKKLLPFTTNFLEDCKDFNIKNEDKNTVCDLLFTMSGTFRSHNESINIDINNEPLNNHQDPKL